MRIPPIEHRFPANRPYAPHAGHKGPYLTPLLKKLLNKEITVNDPDVRKFLGVKTGSKEKFKQLILLRYILNATQGDNQAIEGILDRIDGKLSTNEKEKGGYVTVIVRIGDKSGLFSPAEAGRISSIASEV